MAVQANCMLSDADGQDESTPGTLLQSTRLAAVSKEPDGPSVMACSGLQMGLTSVPATHLNDTMHSNANTETNTNT